MSKRRWMMSIDGLLALLVLTVVTLVWCGIACAEPISDAAKTISGMGPMEIMASLVIVETAALVAVVRLYIKREDRYIERLDRIEKNLDDRPCFYDKDRK